VNVVVHDHSELTAGFEHHREDVDAFGGEKAADARQRARAIGQAKRKLGSNHAQSVSKLNR
jgi:hypothetical protein